MSAEPSSSPQHQPLLGIALVLAAVGFLSVMDALVKVLVDGGLAVLQMLALRSWLVVPVMAAWALRGGGLSALKTRRPGLHLLRVVLGSGAPLMFFTSLKTLPLADATTIFFGTTFLMTALSVPVLKEHVGPHRWAAVIVGFVGVVVAMRPSGDVIDVGALYALGASVSYALFMLVTRKLGSSESALKQVLYFHLGLCLLATASLPFVYRPYTGDEVALVAVIGVLVVGGHLCLTRGFSVAPVGVVAPFEYSAMIWAAALGYLVWGDVPGPFVVVGAALIVLSGLYLTYREARAGVRARRARAVSAEGPVAVIAPMQDVDIGKDDAER